MTIPQRPVTIPNESNSRRIVTLTVSICRNFGSNNIISLEAS